jgi:hypothetical protein
MSNAVIADAVALVAPGDTDESDASVASLLGGPLHRLGQRLRLVRGTNTIRFGVAIGLSLWLSLVATAFVTGNGSRAFQLSSIATHLRLLIVIPLMFVCETWLDPRVAGWVRTAIRSGLVPQSELATVNRLLRRLKRLRNSWWPDVLSAIASLPIIALGTSLFPFGADLPSAIFDVGLWLSLAVVANLTVFRFLVFRWAWRLSLWWWFLWRLSGLKLHLIPSHPDRAAGLGGLEIVQFQFAPLVAGISVLLASTNAEALARGLVPVSIIYQSAGVAVVVGVLIAVLPLALFTPDLIECRARGFDDYMSLASRYVTRFHEKWIVNQTNDDLLGSADIQSLADLSNSVGVVREMRMIPASVRLIVQIALVAFVPMIPLSLFKQSITELLQKVILRLIGG